MNLARKLAIAAAGIAAFAFAAEPKFEAASIRPCGSGGGPGASRGSSTNAGVKSRIAPGRLTLSCVTAGELIRRAYTSSWSARLIPQLSPISGGPAWIDTDRFDINGKADQNASPETLQGPMLQALLQDRFQLKMHREAREVLVYSLSPAKSGLKLQPFREESCTPTNLDAALPAAQPEPGRKPNCVQALLRNGSNLVLEAQGASIAEFAQLLAFIFHRPIVDKTGIVGRFNFRVEYAPDETTLGLGGAPSEPADTLAGPSIFTAIQEQLGLKVESAKGPGEFLVIDSIDRPSAN